MILRTLWCYIYLQVRPLLKWVMHQVTGLCELQRICYGSPAGFQRSSGVEYSLEMSRSAGVRDAVARLDEWAAGGGPHRGVMTYAVSAVVSAKRINPGVHKPFLASFPRCLEHVWGYRRLLAEVEARRSLPYDPADQSHEELLLELWTLLRPGEELGSRVTKRWQEIGFQGDDPRTDFRGMGLLGLDNLVFFAREYPGAAAHVLARSLHPRHGYAFAVVGINMTSLAYSLLRDGAAKSHMYNLCRGLPSYRVFNQMYCYLFYEFDKLWVASRPPDVMHFSFVRDKFEADIRSYLSDSSAVFSIDFVIDTV